MQETSTKGLQEWAWLERKGDQLGIVQETEISPYGICTNQTRSLKMKCIEITKILPSKNTHVLKHLKKFSCNYRIFEKFSIFKAMKDYVSF